MPAAYPPRSPAAVRPRLWRVVSGLAWSLAAWALATAPSVAQPPKTAGGASAVKLPDGTIVFYTKNPDDADPPVDGVFLSPAEYKTLVEQAEQAKKLRSAAKPAPPTGCHVRGRVEARGDRLVAALTVTFTAHTTAPRSAVLLGCQRAFPVAARLGSGKTPVLTSSEDGLVVLTDAPGDVTVTVDLEVPVAAHGPGRDVGFEVGLPRAAITTLAFDPPGGVKKLTVGVRTAADRPGDLRATTGDPAAVAGRAGLPVALGPAERLAVSWDAPTPAAALGESAGVATAETDVTVRVDEAQVEAVAKIRLRGPAREWLLVLPPGADAAAAPATPAARDATGDPVFDPAPGGPMLTRPTDLAKPHWTFRPPDGPGPDWVLTVTARRPRVPTDPATAGPLLVGPFDVPTAVRQTGTVRVFAPPGVRVGAFKPGPGVRQVDAPAGDEECVAAFKFAAVRGPGPAPAAGPLVTFDARRAAAFVRVRPAFALTRVPAGWRLRADVRVTPVRTDVETVLVDVPAGWEGVEVGPPEVVDEVRVEHDGPPRRLAVVLAAARRTPFDLTVTATAPVQAGDGRTASLPLPRFPGAVEQTVGVTASVPAGFEVGGSAVVADGVAQPLTPPAGSRPGVAAAQAGGQFDRAVVRVDLTAQPHRPDLTADVRTEVTVQDRQVVVAETVRFRTGDADPRPVRLTGPTGTVGLRGTAGRPGAAGEWVVTPPAEGAKEFTLTLTYNLPLPPRRPDPVRFAVSLFWPDAVTRLEAAVRVWGGGAGRRVAGFDGPWRELPPEPAADRDALPVLTLAGAGPDLRLGLDLADLADGDGPWTAVDRSVVQAVVSGDGVVAVRSRFLLLRWPASGVDVGLPAGVAADVWVAGRKVDPVPAGTIGDLRVVRVPVPAAVAGRAGVVLDVRYTAPPVGVVRGQLGQAVVPPPRLTAVYRSPPRWHVVLPDDAVPLVVGREALVDTRWAFRRGLLTPVAAATATDLERWFDGGDDPDAGPDASLLTAWADDTLAVRQPVLGPLRVVLVPRPWWVGACSLTALAVGFGLSRLRPVLLGPVLAAVGVCWAVAGVGWPQPTAQVVAGVQPGMLLLAVGIAGRAAGRWYYRHRVAHLPGFTRVPTDPASGTGSASVNPRPSSAPGASAPGSTAPTLVPAGG